MRVISPAMRHLTICLIAFVFTGGGLRPEPAPNSPALPPSANRKVDFVKDIKPLFEASCIQCHAKGKDKGGLSIETRESMLRGGEAGVVAVAGTRGQRMFG